jgi:hypothetical protein
VTTEIFVLSSRASRRGVASGLLFVAVLMVASAGCTPKPNKDEPPKVSAWFDPNGRPYDVPGPVAKIGGVLRLGRFHVPEGPILVGDGSSISPEFRPTIQEFSKVASTGSSDWDVSIIPFNGGATVLRLQKPNTLVEQWSAFESAYGTDGGLGGVTSSVPLGAPGWANMTSIFGGGTLPKVKVVLTTGEVLDAVPAKEEYFSLVMNDADEDQQFDTIVFSNGYGDGGFPLSRGLDSAGETVAIVISSQMLPWRLTVPDGSPPPDVRAEENRIATCPRDVYAENCKPKT